MCGDKNYLSVIAYALSMGLMFGVLFFTMGSLALGIFAIRQFKLERKPRWLMIHRGCMVGVYLGGLIVAGILTLLPGRVFYQLLFA